MSQIMQTSKCVTRISWGLLLCYLEKAEENPFDVRGELRENVTDQSNNVLFEVEEPIARCICAINGCRCSGASNRKCS